MRLLASLLLSVSTAFAHSAIPILAEVHLITLTSIYKDLKFCSDGCNIAYKYFKGEMGEVAWFYKGVPGDSMLKALCKENKCSGCGFCQEKEE